MSAVRYTRGDLLRISGASPEELDALERARLVIPNRLAGWFRRREQWYTLAHLDLLKRYARALRTPEARARADNDPSSVGGG